MEVLRVPPYPITTMWDVPEPNTDYDIYVEDLVDHSFEVTTQTSSANSQIEYILPRAKVQFDRDFLFRILDSTTGEIIVDSNLTVYRPYVDPNMLGTTASEIAEYKELEIISRSIIDAYLGVAGGFYNHKLVIQQVGQGTDYFPVWHETSRVLKAYENGILVFNGEDVANTVHEVTEDQDYTYFNTGVDHGLVVGDKVIISGFTPDINGVYNVLVIENTDIFGVKLLNVGSITTYGTAQKYWQYTYRPTLDNSAIYRYDTVAGSEIEYNRLEYNPTRVPAAMGDLGFYGRGQGIAFPKGYDYTFILDAGYKAIPPDVELAAKYLIEDIKCGNNDYWKRFITQYSTDQFDVKFAPQFLEGTGNIIVDKILSNYKGTTIKPGIL